VKPSAGRAAVLLLLLLLLQFGTSAAHAKVSSQQFFEPEPGPNVAVNVR
jgi:hypothetical protein